MPGRGRAVVRAGRRQILRFTPAQSGLVRFCVEGPVLHDVIPDAALQLVYVALVVGHLAQTSHNLLLVLLA